MKLKDRKKNCALIVRFCDQRRRARGEMSERSADAVLEIGDVVLTLLDFTYRYAYDLLDIFNKLSPGSGSSQTRNCL